MQNLPDSQLVAEYLAGDEKSHIMKLMKKSSFVIILLFLAVVFALPASASVATKAGVKPGNFFYFFDTTFEKINLFFTFNPEKKSQKALEYADERLAEVEAVVKEKNTDAVKTAVAGYESNIALAIEQSKQIKDKGRAEGLLVSITDNISKHQEILSDVLSKVPDEAKEAIAKAIEASRKGQDEAIKQIAELKGEIERLKKEVSDLKENTQSPSINKTTDQATEIEKLKREVESLKNTKVNPPVVDIKPQERPKNSSGGNTNSRQNYDQELSQMIAETRQRISVFNGAVKETEEFISIVKTTINEYLDESIIQQSGQELINETNNLASISKKLVSIETERVNKLSSYLGLGIVPPTDAFSQITQQYSDYYRQYETSNARVESLMQIFVDNEKTALERKLAQKKQELDELKKLLGQEIAARQKTLTDLEAKIEFEQKRYDTACNSGFLITNTQCAAIKSNIAKTLNPLIDQYNALIGGVSGKIYSPRQQTYLKFEADRFGRGGTLYDPNGSTYYTFDCDQWGNCSIYGN